MFDPKQPLWMPQGSVRALLALLVVLATVILIVALGLSGKKRKELGLGEIE